MNIKVWTLNNLLYIITVLISVAAVTGAIMGMGSVLDGICTMILGN